MLPSLGLFKSLPCPLYPNCSRSACFYSHQQQQVLRRPNLDERPTSSIKRQKLSTTASQSEAASSLAAVKTRPTAASHTKLASKAAADTSSSSSLAPIQRHTIGNKLNQALASTSKTKLSQPELRANQAVKPSTQLQPNIPSGSTSTASAETNHAARRVAHKPAFPTRVDAGPPTILPNMRAHAPLKIRQVTATKVFEHFKRIYAPLNNPTLATEHAKRQETQILESTTNVAGYKQQATTVLLALKRRPEAIDPSDIGIVGDWVDPATKPKIDIVEEANNFCLSVDMMTQLGYPLASLLAPSEPIPTIVGTERECCRCKRNYIVKDVLDETDVTLCEYHYGRSRVVRQYGEKHKIYTCCNGSFEDKGCTHGPHVFKETDLQSLHNLIPFIATPAKDPSSTTRRKLVALDCEMAYTTAGMELIRLTALDERLEVLLDELVLPSQMLIDLNTQFSGVKTLEGVKHDLTSVRQELFKYVDADTILIGHGLENDLIAMRVLHEKSIDTAALFPHPEGLPYRYSLRLLCSKYLSKFIQDGSDGHDSYEDAKTCMELLEFHIRKQKK